MAVARAAPVKTKPKSKSCENLFKNELIIENDNMDFR